MGSFWICFRIGITELILLCVIQTFLLYVSVFFVFCFFIYQTYFLSSLLLCKKGTQNMLRFLLPNWLNAHELHLKKENTKKTISTYGQKYWIVLRECIRANVPNWFILIVGFGTNLGMFYFEIWFWYKLGHFHWYKYGHGLFW